MDHSDQINTLILGAGRIYIIIHFNLKIITKAKRRKENVLSLQSSVFCVFPARSVSDRVKGRQELNDYQERKRYSDLLINCCLPALGQKGVSYE